MPRASQGGRPVLLAAGHGCPPAYQPRGGCTAAAAGSRSAAPGAGASAGGEALVGRVGRVEGPAVRVWLRHGACHSCVVQFSGTQQVHTRLHAAALDAGGGTRLCGPQPKTNPAPAPQPGGPLAERASLEQDGWPVLSHALCRLPAVLLSLYQYRCFACSVVLLPRFATC